MWIIGGSVLMLTAQPARAIPPFARQTGMACEACHTIPPELTAFGRRFKLNGYVLTTRPPLVNDIDDYKRNTLWLTDLPGIAVLAQIGYDHYDRAPPDSKQPYPAKAQSDSYQFPDQFSLAYAGAVSDHVGAWLQLTYNGVSGSVGVDNIDIRYSDHTLTNDWVWGVTANNYVTFQDVWNGTGSYTIPVFNTVTLWSSGVAGTGLNTPKISQLGPGNVGGVGAYVFYKDSLYAELSAYHSAVSGSAVPTVDSQTLANHGVVDRFAPYGRIAYEYNWGYHSLEVGATGMYIDWIPNAGYVPPGFSSGGVNSQPFNSGANIRYTDLGFDWQYQYNGQHDIFSFLGHFTHERQSNSQELVSLTASNHGDTLQQTIITAEYYRNRHFGGLVSFARTTGSTDQILNGGTGSPASQYEVFELDYIPWLNFKVLLQYNAYQVVANNQNPFNFNNNSFPSSPGFPNVKASDNNTWVLGLWMDY